MAAKTLFLYCFQAFLIQCAFSQCIPGPALPTVAGPALVGPSLAGPGLFGPGLAGPSLVGLPGAYGCGCGVAATGGGFPVTSISPIAPTGLSVISENTIEGSVIVGGALPFLSTVVLEGLLPTAGTGVISYGCGTGPIGIVNESPISASIVGLPGAAYGPAVAPLAGLSGPSLAPLAGPICSAGLAGPRYGPGIAPVLGLGLGCGL